MTQPASPAPQLAEAGQTSGGSPAISVPPHKEIPETLVLAFTAETDASEMERSPKGPDGDADAEPSTALGLPVRLAGVSLALRNSVVSWASLRLPPDALDEPYDGAPSDRELAGIQLDGPPEFPPVARPLTIMTLPIELQLHIIRQMPFGDIERLRHTCRHYHRLASPPMLRVTLGADNLRMMLLSHCSQCLAFDESRGTLLAAQRNQDFPFSAKCVPCALRSRDPRLSRRSFGTKVELGNQARVWVCWWCGRPIPARPAPRHAQFHHRCRRFYARIIICFFMVGWLQFCLSIVGICLAVVFYRNVTLVFGPCLVRLCSLLAN